MTTPDLIQLIGSIIGALGFLVFAFLVTNNILKLEQRVATLENPTAAENTEEEGIGTKSHIGI